MSEAREVMRAKARQRVKGEKQREMILMLEDCTATQHNARLRALSNPT